MINEQAEDSDSIEENIGAGGGMRRRRHGISSLISRIRRLVDSEDPPPVEFRPPPPVTAGTLSLGADRSISAMRGDIESIMNRQNNNE